MGGRRGGSYWTLPQDLCQVYHWWPGEYSNTLSTTFNRIPLGPLDLLNFSSTNAGISFI